MELLTEKYFKWIDTGYKFKGVAMKNTKPDTWIFSDMTNSAEFLVNCSKNVSSAILNLKLQIRFEKKIPPGMQWYFC